MVIRRNETVRFLILRPLACVAVLVMLSVSAQAECKARLFASPYVMGSPVCIPEKPARIVSLDAVYSLGMSLELGLPLVGAPLDGMSDSALREKAMKSGVTNLGHLMEPSVEKVIGLKPDLIIGSGFLGQNVLQLASRIAPTVLITTESWKDYLRVLVDVTRSDKSADDMLRPYEERAARIREKIPNLKVSVIRITSWDFQVYLDSPKAYAPFAVLRELGVRRSAYETATGNEGMKRPDWEQIAGLDGDILLYIVGGTNTSDTDGRLTEVLNNPLWQRLPAVKAGRVYRVSPATWMEFSGVGSAHKVLDDVERYIVRQP